MDISFDPSSILNGFVGNMINLGIANRNYQFQREQYDYQKQLNTLTMAREDTAVQRKLADLQKAGLSPYLAVNGGGASSSHLASAPAPQNNFQFSPIAMGQMNWKTGIEKKILNAQAKQAEAEADMKSKEKDIAFRNPWLLFGNNIGAVTAFLDDKFPGLIDNVVTNPSEVINDGINKGIDSVKSVVKGSTGVQIIDNFIDKLKEQEEKGRQAKQERVNAEIERLGSWYDSLSNRYNSLPSSLVRDFKLISKNDFILMTNRKRKKLEKKIKNFEDLATAYKNRR